MNAYPVVRSEAFSTEMHLISWKSSALDKTSAAFLLCYTF